MKPKLPDKQRRKFCLKAYVNQDDYELILTLSQRTGFTISDLCRRALLGIKIDSSENQQNFKNLLKVNADLARLGGLLKLGLTSSASTYTAPAELRRILKLIEARQKEMRSVIETIRAEL